ncbi:MAG: sigma-70 family RNA polymerase sigma factor [Christensenellales bacterium]
MIELLTLMLLPLLGAINSQNFPDVLSSDEETKYLEAWRNKDFEARNKLIEHNLRLVAHIVKKFENTGIDKDDLLSIGTFGLIKAIDTFNFDATNKLATYAARCIENEILMHIRSNKKEKIPYLYTHQLVKIKKEMKLDYAILLKILPHLLVIL